MNTALKSLENNALAALTSRAPQAITGAIKAASAKTGVSFSYLMEKAAAESNFNPSIKAKTSSATGLFQFIESTWLNMVEKHGAKYGINTDQSRANLLNLRKDPEIASYMAAEFAQENKAYLELTYSGEIGNTELYFAHFMGASGASGFLNKLQKNPQMIGAELFPKEARANKGVFYDTKTGQPRTLQKIYNFFDKKFSGDTAPATMAHKPKNAGAVGYQHMPFSLKKPIEIRDVQHAMQMNSLYQMQSQLDAFFSKPTSRSNSFYGELRSPSSIILDILK